MDFLNQSWFWTGIFTLLGALGGVTFKEIISSRAMVKLERIRLYESEKFKAYDALYSFISDAFAYLRPLGDQRNDFIVLMKKRFYPDIKSKFLYFDSDIRKTLKTFEAQYECLGDDDLKPPIEQKLFLNKKIFEMLNILQINVEKKVDKLL
ncbi:MAG: hypothetical protein H0Z30_09440 [Candidatus Marinimicrobia bacterium]|nr:hypothetical protein [Candidatus Neomarinimicrobiota bacterium]